MCLGPGWSSPDQLLSQSTAQTLSLSSLNFSGRIKSPIPQQLVPNVKTYVVFGPVRSSPNTRRCVHDHSLSSGWQLVLNGSPGRRGEGGWKPQGTLFLFFHVCALTMTESIGKKNRKLPLQRGRVNGENHGGLEALADMRYRMYSFQKYCHITMFLKKNQAGLLTCCSAAVCTLGPCGALQGGFFSLSHFPLTVQSKGK